MLRHPSVHTLLALCGKTEVLLRILLENGGVLKSLQKSFTRFLFLGGLFPFLSGLFFLPSPSSSLTPDVLSFNRIGAIYAPFDSLRTDIGDYRWPTRAGTFITSSFGDYRRTHFHGGIDISTNNQKGYPVYASRDGHIFRIRISPYGYGKMLYLRHADGYITTYAHLQKFQKEVDSYIKGIQKQSRRYSHDMEIDSTLFSFKKGEVIAYTGDTGVGSAHLHFEVRDAGMNLVNPFLLPAIAAHLEDNVKPTIHAVAFSPLDHESVIQGKRRTWSTEVQRGRGGEYTIRGVVRLTGATGLSVRVTDRSDVMRYRTGAHRLELYLDDHMIFSSAKDRIPEYESKQIAMHYDAHLLRSGKGRFEKLYIAEGNRLPFYNRLTEGAGIIRTSDYAEGKHLLRVVTEDVQGNRSTVTTTVIFNHAPQITLEQVGMRAVLQIKDPAAIRSVTIGSQQKGKSAWRYQTISLDALEPLGHGFALPIDLSKIGALKVVAENTFGTRSAPEFLFTPVARTGNSTLKLRKSYEHGFLHLTLTSRSPIRSKPSFEILSGDRRFRPEAVALDIDEYTATFPWSEAESGSFRINASIDVNGTLVTVHDEWTLFAIQPATGGTIVSDDDVFQAVFPPRSIYAPLVCWIEKTLEGYAIHHSETVLAKAVTVRYASLPARESDRLGLFFSEDKGYELLQGSNEAGVYAGTVGRCLGAFALLPDKTPPEISNIRTSYARGSLRISFRLRDNRSGINAQQLQVLLNGEFLPVEYDPELRSVTYEGAHPLRRGSHTVSIEAADRMGNMTSIQRGITASR